MFGWIGVLFGILLGAFGLFMVFFFPNVTEHQQEEFSISGIIIGIISLVASYFLIFF